MYDGLKHCCVEGDHVVNIFSFSKTYGMMGWRLGYVSARSYSLPDFEFIFMERLILHADSLLRELRWVCGRALENSRQHPNMCLHNISATGFTRVRGRCRLGNRTGKGSGEEQGDC